VLRFMPARDPTMPEANHDLSEDYSPAGAIQWDAEGHEAPSAR
jgi:hypothetical protein